ncbi:unnamed protein product [Phyllotreta striolata]|uniref:FERM domain-containing protein n=1 Tax=Phyllotreta striolata TaxID=444603 RepID=A0A9N9TZ48_PHYSR|nr:unnamed protein product [Phyllotreta striolata]
MRAGLCTVSAPLAACSPAAALPPTARFLALHVLHQQTLYFIVQAKSRVRELYQQTCRHFALQGMLDTDLFGLALICDGEYLFAEPDSKLSKYAPKSWRSSHSHGLDANGRPALAFYFRVQFYVDSPLLLRDETTRHHYYLQLRLNAASGAAGDHAAHLAGLALQADLGDHGDAAATFRPEDYVPPDMRGPAALRLVDAAHRTHRGLSKNEARTRFIADTCQLQEPVNAHVFRLRASKSEPSPGSLILAVCPRGLKVCPENNPPSIFLWSSIGKLSFERKKFEIRTGHEKLTLYTSSDEKSRLLLGLCKAAHQFSMAVAPRLSEARREEEERRRWDGDQRVSVISSTSSNTTSGIVSDRVHSEDELEIMITSPPAPSTESLALAHLLDSAPASSRTSAASAAAALATLALKEDEDEAKPTLSESSTKTANGKCAGSQCSSSCSTVVVTPVQTKTKGRRSSTTSSLELGYSHTAQNSSVSDATCIELDATEAVYTSGPAPSSHTSGVYTLTSSEQYTLSSSDHYTSPSEQYSVPSEQFSTPEDHVDGHFRDRTNSNVSNSGSFHGDGSDPTDAKQTLLSAEELSDLIVGRYPSCKSVSHTLDSDSDYVTLPSSYQGYAPVPPKRIDSVDQRFRPPPPPYGAQLSKPPPAEPACLDFDDCSAAPGRLLRSPPPYPENTTPVPPPVYPFEEAGARFITTRSPSVLTAHASSVGVTSSPSYSTPNSVPPIPPKIPRPPPKNAVVSPNNYLDVAASKASVLVPCTFLPPPPPPAPRQPPPPPPTSLATVYPSQLSLSQIEQYQQQMYSDVDFVVFPLKEPAISKQEYLEAKQGASLMAALAQQPIFYRSTPYLSRYASSQNLSDTYVQLPVYGAPSVSSTGSLDPPPPPLPPNRPGKFAFTRTRSDDNILNSLDLKRPPKFRRLPPPPPPVPEKPADAAKAARKPASPEKASALDIRTLREKSKKMDLPLISALCNDRSLIKQTKAFVTPKVAGEGAAPSKLPAGKQSRKTPSVHRRNPGDKLPEIPRATPNNYILTDLRVKHKTVQSQS